MAIKNSNSDAILTHKHSRLHVLISILAIVIFLGTILLYIQSLQIKDTEKVMSFEEITNRQIDTALMDLKNNNAEPHPKTDEAIKQALESLEKSQKSKIIN